MEKGSKEMELKIIDFEKKGNQVKFILGDKKLKDWYGDDWDDRPYEHNAGSVYDEFVKGEKVLTFDWYDAVLEPCSGAYNSQYTKDDMKARRIPCIVVVDKSLLKEHLDYWGSTDDIDFNQYASSADNKLIKKFYFGDIIEMEE